MERLVIAVGSKNPIKISASATGLSRAFSKEVDSSSFDSPSGVSNQPIGDEETKVGAGNRAKNAFQSYFEENGKPPQFSVGLEGGIVMNNGVMECFAWICVYNGEKLGLARTAAFALPQRIQELVLGGMELGHADDAVFGSVNAKQAGGTVGHLTKGVINRSEYYEQAVVLAAIPFHWPELY